MDLPILFIFGFFFTVVVLCASKPETILSRNNNWTLIGGEYSVNSKTRYFPLIVFVGMVFVVFAAFQDIYAGIYDLSNYKSFFDDARQYASLKEYLSNYNQEAIYLTLNWLFSRFTDSFTIILIFFFSIVFLSIFRFYHISDVQPSLILFFSVFSLVFTFVVQSYCLLRTGLSVSIGLFVFSELQGKHTKRVDKAYQKFKIVLWTIVAIGIHTLGLFILPVIVMNWILNRTKLRTYIIIFIILFVIGYIGSQIIVNYFSFYNRFFVYLSQDAKPAYKTYLANFILIIFILFKKKYFFRNKSNLLHFNLLICSFYIFDLEIMMSSIMFRMIYFTRPSTTVLIAQLWKLYIPKKNELIIPLLVRAFLIIYILLFLYGFITAMPRYGLNYYKFGAIY